MSKDITYPSKITLVGEYRVVIGGSALTIPFSLYKASIKEKKRDTEGERRTGGIIPARPGKDVRPYISIPTDRSEGLRWTLQSYQGDTAFFCLIRENILKPPPRWNTS